MINIRSVFFFVCFSFSFIWLILLIYKITLIRHLLISNRFVFPFLCCLFCILPHHHHHQTVPLALSLSWTQVIYGHLNHITSIFINFYQFIFPHLIEMKIWFWKCDMTILAMNANNNKKKNAKMLQIKKNGFFFFLRR